MTVDEIFRCATKNNLARDADACIFLETDRGFFRISVVKDNCYTGLGYAGLSALVNQVLYSKIVSDIVRSTNRERDSYLEILCSNCGHVGDAQHEANGI